jgi:hypothetical protein
MAWVKGVPDKTHYQRRLANWLTHAGPSPVRRVADLSLIEKTFERPSLQGLARSRWNGITSPPAGPGRETRLYITSLRPDPAHLNRVIRQHWRTKTNCTGYSILGFCEGLSRKCAGHVAQNFSILDRIALNLLKQDKSSKRGIKGKMAQGRLESCLSVQNCFEFDLRRP